MAKNLGSDLVSVWLRQSHDFGQERSGGRFYFQGDTIYSYGSHFPIAALSPKAKFKPKQTVYAKVDKKLRQATVVEVHTVEGLAIGKPGFKYVLSSDTPAGFNERYEVWEHSVFATPNAAFGL
jgi:hypothetical protein